MRRSAALVLCAMLLCPAATGAETLPQLGQVPDFALTDEAGQPVTRQDVDGAVWVADFIFTRCAGQCPMMSQRMKSVQDALKDTGVQLVSFTVDPDHDTAEVLKTYAARSGAVPGRWRFVTGPREAIWRLAREGFRVGIADDGTVEEPIAHSTRLILVDGTGAIRGYYDAMDDAAVARLTADARRLAQE